MVKITWINHACFMVESNDGKRIYFDPYEIPFDYRDKPATIILGSHDHHDHLDRDSIKLIQSKNTQIIIPKTCTNALKTYSNSKGVEPGDNLEVEGIKIEVTAAYNPTKRFHPKGNKWVGYIVDVDGTKIYHAGDTDYIPEFEDLKGKVDVAFLPVGDTYTMDFKQAIKAAAVIQPKIVVPCHHWDKDLEKFKSDCEKENPSVKVEILLNKVLEL